MDAGSAYGAGRSLRSRGLLPKGAQRPSPIPWLPPWPNFVGPGLFGLAHDLSGSYAASLCLCIGLQLASSLIILCAPRIVREPVSATEGG
jgi:hypothetical protein